MCAVILIPPGRNCKLLPALAKNVPPARFLNASRPRAKRQRAPGFGGVYAAFAVSNNTNMRNNFLGEYSLWCGRWATANIGFA